MRPGSIDQFIKHMSPEQRALLASNLKVQAYISLLDKEQESPNADQKEIARLRSKLLEAIVRTSESPRARKRLLLDLEWARYKKYGRFTAKKGEITDDMISRLRQYVDEFILEHIEEHCSENSE